MYGQYIFVHLTNDFLPTYNIAGLKGTQNSRLLISNENSLYQAIRKGKADSGIVVLPGRLRQENHKSRPAWTTQQDLEGRKGKVTQ
jgi:hypothetical protein